MKVPYGVDSAAMDGNQILQNVHLKYKGSGKPLKLACAGQDTRLVVYISDESIVESDVPGHIKRQVRINGSGLCDASGVLHAGALGITGMTIDSSSLNVGIIAVKECTEDTQVSRPFPSVSRVTLVSPDGYIAGFDCSGISNHCSPISMCTSIAGYIPGCNYQHADLSPDQATKRDAITLRWWQAVGTPKERIAYTCTETMDPYCFGIPINRSGETCCMSKFVTNLIASGNNKKMQTCFGKGQEMTRDQNGDLWLRITGDEGQQKVEAAKAELCNNMKESWCHHGIEFNHYTPDCVAFKPGCVSAIFHRNTSGTAQTIEDVSSQSGIEATPEVVIEVGLESMTEADKLRSAVSVPFDEASKEVQAKNPKKPTSQP